MPNQPFRFGLLCNLLQFMQDPDIGLFYKAESGFHRGAFEPLRFSGIWPHQQTDTHEHRTFKIFDTNWMSAEEDPDTVSRLIEEDIDAKFVQEFHGDIAQAKKSAGHKPQRCQVRPTRPAPLLCTVQYRTSMQRSRLEKSLSTSAWRTLFLPQWSRIRQKESASPETLPKT